MSTHMRNAHLGRRSMRVLLAGAVTTALVACSSLLDVKNPNDVAESALSNPAAAGPMANGVLASTVRMISAITAPYSVATDELDWIGSRDAWNDLETGAIANFLNEFTDGAFPYVGEARYLADATIARLEAFDAAGTLTNRSNLARTYLYAAIVYTSIADMYDDYAFSTKTVAAPPVGRANMFKLYDDAVAYLDKANTIANSASGADFTALRYPIMAYRARVKHAKAVHLKITPKKKGPVAAPLVNDAGANADATAAIALGAADEKFVLVSNIEAQPGIQIWFEVNGRNEHKLGTVYTNLTDPVMGVKDPVTQALLAEFTAFGSQDGAFTLTSNRELWLILAEGSLAAGQVGTFTTQLNNARALGGKTAWAGVPAAQTMLAYERQAQLWLMRRRLSDMYRFGVREIEWTANPNFDSAFDCIGLLFPIPNVERLGNKAVVDAPRCQ